MKQNSPNKNRKWLWLILGVALLVVAAVAAVVIGKVFFSDNTPDLYWNITREENTDPNTGLSIREPGEDGLYHILFAHDGEQVELPVADKQLVGVIDALDVMGLELDKEGVVESVTLAENAASVLCDHMYIQEITGDTIVVNSSIAMAGKQTTLKITERLRAYNVSGKGEFVGQEITLQDLQPMDTISVYGVLNPRGGEAVATHIFVTKQWEIGKVYWRTERLYDSKTKATTRTPDENGVYTVAFYCDGETVELKFKDKVLVNNVDYVSANSCYFGFEFDAEGYVSKILNSNKSTHTVLQCERFHIQELKEDGSYVAADILGKSGKTVQGVIGKDCAIYDISATAKADGALNRKVDSLQLNDRVYIWTDTVGTPVLVYITDRRPDSPAYYNPDPQYDSEAKQTKRTPNADGYYEVQLLKAGETELQTYYVKDIKHINTIDSASDRCVGLKLSEGNIVECVYSASSLFGNSYFCRGYNVKEATSSMVTLQSKTGKTTKYGILSAECKVWNVSDVGQFGELTTLQEGDNVYAMQAPTGEIINIYVIRRTQEEKPQS